MADCTPDQVALLSPSRYNNRICTASISVFDPDTQASLGSSSAGSDDNTSLKVGLAAVGVVAGIALIVALLLVLRRNPAPPLGRNAVDPRQGIAFGPTRGAAGAPASFTNPVYQEVTGGGSEYLTVDPNEN